jgi:peptidoglycan/xylan/chitin deacetylase (PgdA/CDA1 family)
MKITFSFDDGTEYDRKIIELLKKYNFYTIFYIPISSWGFNNLDIYKQYEIGGHTWSHPSDLRILSDNELKHEIIDAYNELSKYKKLKWFCYPRGRYNQRVIDYVKKAGFERARTTKIGFVATPYEVEGYHLYQRKEYGTIDWLEYISEVVERNPFRWLHIWGHSQEIEKYNQWGKIKKLFEKINENCCFM